MLVAHGAGADMVRFSHSVPCVDPFVTRPASKTALYGEAYEWTRHAPLSDWRYDTVTYKDIAKHPLNVSMSTQAECARISYTTPVRMPAILQQYTSLGKFRTHVVKTTCVEGRLIFNSVQLSKLPFIGEVAIVSTMTARSGHLVTDTYAEYTMPWYIGYLQAMAKGILVKSYKQEITATAHEICGDGV